MVDYNKKYNWVITLDGMGRADIDEIPEGPNPEKYYLELDDTNKPVIYEIFTGTWKEAKSRAKDVALNQHRVLMNYDPKNPGNSHVVARGQAGVDFFLQKEKEEGMEKIGEGRIEGNGGGFLLSFHGIIG